MQYEHTQRGWFHHILLAVALALLAGAWLAGSNPAVAVLNVCIAALLLIVALLFGSLCVRDEGEWLALRFGPLPVLCKRICYADITSVEPGRSAVIDGWGIHHIPGRGWTYNLWGFGCVKLTVGKKVIRVGSDDVDNLAAFLKQRPGPESDRPNNACCGGSCTATPAFSAAPRGGRATATPTRED